MWGWHKRDQWQDCKVAVNVMVAHTSAAQAPWTLISGNEKNYARIQILETSGNKLELQYIYPSAAALCACR
ncbi:MAG: hypothetical protein EXR84_13380 [Gammaproteobacteria bacterium]|nr:hypothetical protein [Gammaproteobacteria bacterium]